MPKPQKGYVSLMLPRRYLMGLLPANIRTPPTHTYSKNEMAELFKLDQVKLDLQRLALKFGEGEKNPKFHGSMAQESESTTEAMVRLVNSSGFPLTKDEATALCAFSTADASNKAAQEGFFRFPELVIPHVWLAEFPIGNQTSLVQVTRNKKNNNLIISAQFQFPYRADRVPTGFDPEKPIIQYSNEYELTQTGDNFTLTHLEKPEHSTVLIEENFFNENLMNKGKDCFRMGILELLPRYPNFNDPKDVDCFVPFLTDNDVFNAFSLQLKKSHISFNSFSYLLNKVELCFGNGVVLGKPDFSLLFWQFHKWKMTLPTTTLTVCALVSIIILLAAGPIGGPLLFGTITAAISVFLAITAIVISTIIDNKNQPTLKNNLLGYIQTLKDRALQNNATKDEPGEVNVDGENNSITYSPKSVISTSAPSTTDMPKSTPISNTKTLT